MEEFPSGQRGQTVNLLLLASVVRIHPPPPNRTQTNTLFFKGYFVTRMEIWFKDKNAAAGNPAAAFLLDLAVNVYVSFLFRCSFGQGFKRKKFCISEN